MAKTKILIIGLDGVSPHLVRRWRDALPNLDRLMREGASGTLQSVIPPRSIPAWYCFATGMNPAKLGVFGFSQRIPGKYDYTFANLTYCRAPTFWQWLNQNGLKTAVVHVPGTYPPHEVDGALVSGWPAPLNRGNLTYTHPPALSRELDAALGQPFEFLSPKPMRTDNDAEVLADRLRLIEMHGRVARKVLTEQVWDVGIVVFSESDRASHQFWRHLDPAHPAHDADLVQQFRDALRQVYTACDAEVGRLLELLDADDTVFIISDHGFGPANRVFYLNEWLRQQGYLVMREESNGKKHSLVGRLAAPLFWLNRVSPTFRRLAAPFKKRAFSNFIRDEYVIAKEGGVSRLNHLPVDWSRTRVYCPDEGALYLNLKGRDPEGTVEPGSEADDLLDEISVALQRIPDPRTGELIPVSLHRKEDVYTGPFLADAPELFVAMDGYATEVMAETGSGQLWVSNPARNGTHTLEGLLIARGPDIPAGKQLHAGLMDIAPTTVHLAGLPVLEEMDGQVLLSLFAKDSRTHRRPIEKIPVGLVQQEAGIAYSEDEAFQVENRLRDLGYLG
ncbi:MAG TPA: alkaline phosphatase family protein [Anaerolineales bacterium]|nr:alkaline phosphatase family protein [Anaerolineales bacterium]